MMNGFRYIDVPEIYHPNVEPVNGRMQFYVQLSDAIKSFENQFMTGQFYDVAIKEFDPQFVFLDLTNVYYAPLLIAKKIPFIILNTKVCSDFDRQLPPPVFATLPIKNRFLNRALMWVTWKTYFLRRSWKNAFDDASPVKLSRLNLALRYADSVGIDLHEQLLTDRAIHYGVKNVPELFLVPCNFDLPYKLKKNQYFLSPCFYGDREEILTQEASQGLARLEKIKDGKKIIYASFGSCEVQYQQTRIDFVNKLIEISEKHQEYFFVISIGNNLDTRLFTKAPNIIIENILPQLQIISIADVVITHGGMQTIEECIYYGKPILVYPLSIGTDQFGNSCRVVYHNVGLRGNVNRDSASAIETKLHQLLSGPYRKNIQKMRQEYLESRSFDEGVAKINELIGSTIVREVV